MKKYVRIIDDAAYAVFKLLCIPAVIVDGFLLFVLILLPKAVWRMFHHIVELLCS